MIVGVLFSEALQDYSDYSSGPPTITAVLAVIGLFAVIALISKIRQDMKGEDKEARQQAEEKAAREKEAKQKGITPDDVRLLQRRSSELRSLKCDYEEMSRRLVAKEVDLSGVEVSEYEIAQAFGNESWAKALKKFEEGYLREEGEV